MHISKKTDYALRALFTLVEHYEGTPIPIRELARRNDIPKRFLEQIMLALKAQGWVESLAGMRGG
jgi:Rrf2 family protein